jgi:LacI family transcriptional regulator
LDSSFDGLIVVPTVSFHGREAYRELLESGKATVFLERDLGEDNTSVVTADAVRSISLAVRHLASLGHRRIALCELYHEDPDSYRRRAGYQTAYEELSLRYDPSLVMSAASNQSTARGPDEMTGKLKRLMNLPDRPTAVVGISASRCVAIYEGLSALGYCVPEDVSLVAITGQTFGSFHRARMTSVRYSYEEMGCLACRILIGAIENPGSHPQRVYVPAQLVEGDTTCRPGGQ